MSDTELVDLVDREGKIQVRGIPRDQVDKYPDLYLPIVVVVTTNPKGEYLVHQRPHAKDVDGGLVDHVCGGIRSGETPLVAAPRESLEETGVQPKKLRIIEAGVNSYGRYRYLIVGSASGKLTLRESKDATWIDYKSLEALRADEATGEYAFVGEFFEDIELIRQAERREGEGEVLQSITYETRNG